MLISTQRGGRGGVLLGILGGSVTPVLQILTLFYFRPKNVIFHTRFQTWSLGRHYLLKLERKQNNSSYAFRIRIFGSYSFGIETIISFICSRSSLENHTRFQTKIGKVYTRFQTRKAQNPYPLGRHIPIRLIKWSTPWVIREFRLFLRFREIFLVFAVLDNNG